MQAALMIRSKQRIARNKERRLRMGIKGDIIPSNVATKDIPPYPQFPPESWRAVSVMLLFVLVLK